MEVKNLTKKNNLREKKNKRMKKKKKIKIQMQMMMIIIKKIKRKKREAKTIQTSEKYQDSLANNHKMYFQLKNGMKKLILLDII